MSTAAPIVASIPAAVICARYELKSNARKLLQDGMSTREFAEALVKKNEFVSAIEFVAHALPPREAIWWGALCVQHITGDAWAPADRSACLAAVRWVMQPTEQNRALAAAPGQAAGAASPAGRLAVAVSQLRPSEGQQPPPAGTTPFAANATVADAIKLASVKCDPKRIKSVQGQFAQLGLQFAVAPRS